jgi:hypothetical protein
MRNIGRPIHYNVMTLFSNENDISGPELNDKFSRPSYVNKIPEYLICFFSVAQNSTICILFYSHMALQMETARGEQGHTTVRCNHTRIVKYHRESLSTFQKKCDLKSRSICSVWNDLIILHYKCMWTNMSSRAKIWQNFGWYEELWKLHTLLLEFAIQLKL